MTISWLYSILLGLQLSRCLVTGNYRRILFSQIENQDNGKTTNFTIGTGAAIFSIDKHYTSGRQSYNKFQLKMIADEGYGLMVYTEDMYLRTQPEREGCLDYVQFGRDDMIPFWTLHKSEKICGNKTGHTFFDPDGELLIWLSLTSLNGYQESSQVVRLSLVVTAYKDKEPTLSGFRPCVRNITTATRWIRNDYFCDKRVNCAVGDNPADERQDICNSIGGKESGNAYGDGLPPLNLVSITLILVSCVVVVVLLFLLVLRMKIQCVSGCLSGRADSDCDLPEHGVGIIRAGRGFPSNRTRRPRPDDELRDRYGRARDANYVPLSTFTIEPRRPEDDSLHDRTLLAGSAAIPDNEPPPAYHELFPPGFKYTPKKYSEGAGLEEPSPPEEDLVDANVRNGCNKEEEPEPEVVASGADGVPESSQDDSPAHEPKDN